MKTMTKLFLALCLSISIPLAYADSSHPDTANINIRISGAQGDNRYFLCIPNVGCLSILAGEEGRTYPIIHDFKLYNLYLSDINGFRIYYEGLPSSCQGTIKQGSTVTISGHIAPGSGNKMMINGLSCSIS